MGDAMVTTEQVRLTSDMQSKQRAVWSRIDLFTGLGVLVDTYPNEEKHLEAQKMRYTTRTQRIYPFVLAMVSAPPCCATTITTLSSSSDTSAAHDYD
ncbi:VIP36-like protein isoform X1 [Oncorhynchus mykiss]|uniref:VIP36-like protein isoform X1 n=1 Tax=Oncorhynchus mykiss TaxID=8022 RepID=UPI0018783499|nr:VIP36-like protein isoform X1 [Oncorhynchus mykiss]